MKRLAWRKFGKGPLNTTVAIVILGAIASLAIGATMTISTIGLIGFWTGDGDAIDIANGNDGTLINGATFDTGIVGQAFSFDGIDDAVVIPESTDDLDGFSELTLSAWINVKGYNADPGIGTLYGGIITKYDSDNGVSYTFLARESGKVTIYVAESNGDYWITDTNNSVIDLDTWTHVVGVWRGGDDFEICINGNLVPATLTKEGAPSHMANNAVPVNIGRYQSAGGSYTGPFGHFQGQIDEARIYNRALSADEIHSLYLAAFNQNPTADAGLDQILECTSSDGALVALDGSGSDPDDDDLTYSWDVPDGVLLDDPSSANPSGVFPIGITTATLTVDDGNAGIAVDDVLITVVDTTPPEVHCTTDIASIWPPNHQQVPVQIFVDATDSCSNPSELILTSLTITSSEPDNGLGDGDTSGDISGLNGFVSPIELAPWFTYNSTSGSFEGIAWLRAERSGNGSGRSYTIQATVVDNHTNLATSSCVVVVPKNKRKAN